MALTPPAERLEWLNGDLSEQERQARFREIDRQIQEEVRKHPDDLGTLSDIATIAGGGESLGESISSLLPGNGAEEDDRLDHDDQYWDSAA